MKFLLGCIVCGLLFTASGVSAEAFNGQVRGTVDNQAIDVAVRCERQTLGKQKWFMAQSDPSMHSGLTDRNGDGVAVNVSSNGEQVVFEVLVAGQNYRIVGTRDVVFSDNGLVIEATMKRYEGKGKTRTEIGQYGVHLALDCPEG
jgi:uncharacterized membrane protein YciS (DUF1049 family)